MPGIHQVVKLGKKVKNCRYTYRWNAHLLTDVFLSLEFCESMPDEHPKVWTSVWESDLGWMGDLRWAWLGPWPTKPPTIARPRKKENFAWMHGGQSGPVIPSKTRQLDKRQDQSMAMASLSNVRAHLLSPLTLLLLLTSKWNFFTNWTFQLNQMKLELPLQNQNHPTQAKLIKYQINCNFQTRTSAFKRASISQTKT